ncbi:hypothetical protein [Sutterella sp.]|uniref:hypothetical protein n=1 Tax=Sutterella sp. TaxID=1981025 RepID=UPI0026DF067B|nr:hypothetical protein [Sutterella sp.]MDO5531607.1 hypothetical protein [Sutterella sp.]
MEQNDFDAAEANEFLTFTREEWDTVVSALGNLDVAECVEEVSVEEYYEIEEEVEACAIMDDSDGTDGVVRFPEEMIPTLFWCLGQLSRIHREVFLDRVAGEDFGEMLVLDNLADWQCYTLACAIIAHKPGVTDFIGRIEHQKFRELLEKPRKGFA